jgi:TolA-binding protein
MKNYALILGCLLFVGGAYAQSSKACDTETKKAKTIYDKCVKIGKGKNGYEQCVKEYNDQKGKAAQACRTSSVSSVSDLETAVKKWEDLSKDNKCRTNEKKKVANCTTVLQQWGQELYKLEEYNFTKEQDEFQNLVQWCADRDNNVKKYPQCAKTSKAPTVDHSGALPIFIDYVKFFPDGSSAPNMLFQASFIYETKGNLDSALILRRALVTKYPNHTLAPGAWLRIGEHYYNNSKWADAIKAYEKITGKEVAGTNKKEAAYAMYHLAESYYNQADYEVAAQKFWEYIDGADKGKYIKDLRVEAMDYMATAFSDLDDGIKVAEKFIKSKNVPYKDSLYFRIGMKAKDHDRMDQALQAFGFLIETNRTYIDAPLADLAIVDIYLLQQKPDLAQKQRFEVIKRYDRNSPWYKKNSGYPESVKSAEDAMRRSMLEIPFFMHAKAIELHKKGDTEGAKKEFRNAIENYNNFLSRYKNEPDWHEYKVHMQMSEVYRELDQFDKQAAELNWIVDVDTSRYGRRPQNFGVLISKNDAGFNAVLAMDVARENAMKNKAGGDTVKAYGLPETKAYFAQVDKYMAKFGKDTAAPDLAYNAAIVHYDAKQYKAAINGLQKLKSDFPKHKRTLLINRMLAQSLLEDGQLDESLKEFESLYIEYTSKNGMGVRDSNATNVAKEIETSIAAVLYQKAEKAVKNGQFAQGAESYVALVKRFPRADFSDKALFEAASAYESAGQNAKAAETWMRMPKEYGKSGLAIRSIVRAAGAYKKDGKYVDAAKAYLFITDNYAQDTMAINAIFAAAQTYDSIPAKDSTAIRANKKLSAQTYEIAFKKFPKHEKTPGLLYNACLAYDDSRDTKEAIRCNKLLVSEYPKSSYALDAAYSIPVAYENAKDWKNAVIEYENFIKNYQSDKEKLINAYTKTGRAYLETKDTAKSAAAFKNTIATYDKFGVQLKNADPAFAAEAAFMLGEFEKATMNPLVIKGNEKAKIDMVKKLMGILQSSTKHYAKSAEYASEKWTFRAKNRIAELFVTVSAKVREQEIDVRDKKGKVDKERLFVERIMVVQQLPSYYESATPLFQANIDLARDQGYYNPDVVAAQDGYIEMYYRNCANFDEVGNAFAEAPLPDSVAMVKEFMEYEGMAKEDAVFAVTEDLEAYREELLSKSQTAKQGALPHCSNGIKAAAHYGIKNRWTDSLYALVKKIDAENAILSTQIKEFDPSTLFRDDNYNKTKARLTQVEKSEDLTPQEQIKIYKEISAEAKGKNAKLKSELANLRAQWKAKQAPPPSQTGGM